MLILCHASIIPEENASKIVKISPTHGEVMSKITVASFLWYTVFMNDTLDGIATFMRLINVCEYV